MMIDGISIGDLLNDDRWHDVLAHVTWMLDDARKAKSVEGAPDFGLGAMRSSTDIEVERAIDVLSMLALRCGANGPPAARILHLFVDAYRLLYQEDWFIRLWAATPSHRIGQSDGWYKLGDGGVPYAIAHHPDVIIKRSGEISCGVFCPPLPSLGL